MAVIELEAIRTDEYKIEFDETIINEEWMKDYSEGFSYVDNYEDLAKNLAYGLMRYGSGSFIEGFGRVQCFRMNGTEIGYLSEGEEYTPGIKVTVLAEDDNHDFEIV